LLAFECGWTKPAASQHLKVLRNAGLVDVRADGNRRLYRARRDGLAELRAFLDEFWTARLAVLEDEISSAR
jgi:DNA-binding transcriptional ArsR family regulator